MTNLMANSLRKIRDQFTTDHWRRCGGLVEEALKPIQSSGQASQALRGLVRAGCNPAVVLHEIGFYCASGDEFWNKRARYARSQLKAIAAGLEEDACVLERVVSEFMKESADQYDGVLHSPMVMRQIAQSLKMARATLTKHTHGKTGTTKHLVYLSYHIKAATKRRHYKEIAALIACVQGDTSCNVVKFADSIRNEIRRHEKQHPHLFQEEKAAIERSLRAWREWSSSGKTTGH